MIVVDTSVMVEHLAGVGPLQALASATLTSQPVAVPHGIDLECANALRRIVAAGAREPAYGSLALAQLRDMPISRHSHAPLLPRIWELRDHMWPYDAAFVALAEALDAPLVTVDSKFSGVPGLHCEIRNLRAEGG